MDIPLTLPKINLNWYSKTEQDPPLAANVVCLFQTPVPWATLAQHIHIIPFWNKDDTRIKTPYFTF